MDTFSHFVFDPLAIFPMSRLEIVATVFGLWSVWAYAREHMSAWPAGLINVLLYIVLFANLKLFGETGLQIVFVVLQVYGWWAWARGNARARAAPPAAPVIPVSPAVASDNPFVAPQADRVVPAGPPRLLISRTTSQQWAIFATIAVCSIVPMALGLKHYTDSSTPWWDAIPTVLSLIAQWMLDRKILENWYVWIVVDCFSIPLFAYKELYLTAGLYAVFLVLCIFGARAWHLQYRSTATA